MDQSADINKALAERHPSPRSGEGPGVRSVFKFGGASVNSVDRIKNVASILRGFSNQKILIVISAMGKTTNALEKVVEAFYNNQQEQALQLFEQVKNQHLTTAKYLLVQNYLACEAQLRDFFTEVEWLLHDKPVREFDYYYDQVFAQVNYCRLQS